MAKFPVFFFVSALMLLSPLSVGAESDAEEKEFLPQQGSMKILDFSHNGSGCPQGSVLSDISPDGEVISLFFSIYNVEKPSDSPLAKVESRCRMKFGVEAPVGWSHALYSMNVQGFADLETGLIGSQKLNLVTPNDASDKGDFKDFRMKGPYSDQYIRTNTLPYSSLRWSVCGSARRQITVDSAIVIETNSGKKSEKAGFMTSEVIENVLDPAGNGKSMQQFGVLWKRCPQGNRPQRKSIFGTCQVQLVDKKTGDILTDRTLKARSPSRKRTLEKIDDRAHRLCQKSARDYPKKSTRCVFDKNTCQFIDISD